ELLEKTIDNAKRYPVELDTLTLNFNAANCISLQMKKLENAPENLELMASITAMIRKIEEIALDPDLWEARNIAFSLHHRLYPQHEAEKRNGDLNSKTWCQHFDALYLSLNLKL
ncbi:MAG TPA: hypothetical protein VK927_07960, partial [Adhaeribacter sp.]|nr:hypothetical protein [Adhaeribacter sp.]